MEKQITMQLFKNRYGINPIYFLATVLVCSIPFLLNKLGYNTNLHNEFIDLSNVDTLNELDTNNSLRPLLKGKFIHTLIVGFSITIAFVTTVLSFIDYFIKKNVSTPIVGIALFCAGMLDFVHIISADQIIHYNLNAANISSFTWLFSRIFHAIILIFGVSVFLLQKKESYIEEYKSEKYFLGFIGFIFFLLSINAVLIITDENLDLPTMVFPEVLIAHPYDLIPLLLYLIAGIFVFPKYYRENKNTFSQTLLLSLIPSIIAQLHMVFGSKEIYDYDFFAAQLLKSVSYFVPFIGLTINYIQTYQNETKIAEELDIQLNNNERIKLTLEGVLDASLNGIMSLAPVKNIDSEVVDFEWTMVNHKAEVDMNYTAKQLIGNTFFSILPTGQFLFDKYKEVYLTGKSNRFTIESRGRHYDISVSKFDDFIAITFNDITDQIVGQEAILNFQKIQATSKFARLMTHEIRNPLTNILLSVEQLKAEVTANETTKVYLDILGRNTLRINELVSEVMNASKLTDLNFSRINAKRLIEICIENVEDRLKLKNIKLKVEIKEDELLEVDIDKIKIAIVNILLNAIEAMNHDSAVLEIVQFLDKTKSETIIKISDNGVGIPESNLGRLFEPFYTNKTKGFGIGLTAAQTIIFNHKGNIKVQSIENIGTTFTISLPIFANRS